MKPSPGNLAVSSSPEQSPPIYRNAVREWREELLPLASWAMVQLAALGLAVFEIPLATGASGYPRPATLLAAHIIADAQIVVGSLFFPVLFRTGRASVLTITTTIPFLAAGSFFSGLNLIATLALSAYVCGWLASLALWRNVFKANAAQGIGAALAGTFAAGGAILWYLRQDFSLPPRPTDAIPELLFGPVIGVNALVRAESHRISAFLAPFASITLAAFVLTAQSLRRKRRKLAK